MLDSESKNLLYDLITKLRQGEHNIEILRIVLCENPEFDPYQAFQTLCTVHTGCLIPKDISDFLSLRGIKSSDTDLYLLIKQYSSELNGRLTIDDFFQLVLPSTNPGLRSIANARCLPHRRRLTPTVEYSLSKLLETELSFQKDLEKIKGKLSSLPGYTTLKAFNALDKRGKGYISENDFIEFSREFGNLLLEQDLDDILRRIDTEEDAVITYNEFLDFMLPLNQTKQEIASSKDSENKSEDRPRQEEKEDSKTATPKKEEFKFETPNKKGSPDMRESDLKESPEVPQSKEEPCLIDNLLKIQLFSIRKLEFLKQNLSILEDFSIPSLFKLIDREDTSIIKIEDLERFLNALEITGVNLSFIFKTYGKPDNTINIDKFKQIFTPKDLEYAEILLSRQNEDFEFGNFTLDAIKEFFEVLVDNERKIEEAKNELQNKPDFDIKSTLRFMDCDEDGQISLGDFDIALKKMGIVANKQDTLAFFELYDKYREEVVSFENFAEYLGF